LTGSKFKDGQIVKGIIFFFKLG